MNVEIANIENEMEKNKKIACKVSHFSITN